MAVKTGVALSGSSKPERVSLGSHLRRGGENERCHCLLRRLPLIRLGLEHRSDLSCLLVSSDRRSCLHGGIQRLWKKNQGKGQYSRDAWDRVRGNSLLPRPPSRRTAWSSSSSSPQADLSAAAWPPKRCSPGSRSRSCRQRTWPLSLCPAWPEGDGGRRPRSNGG